MSTPTATSLAAESGFARIGRRILPMAVGLYILSYLDRVNLSFAAPTMSKDLGLDPSVYGMAAGLFFVTYAFLEIPSSLAAQRFGTRLWLGRIMITWGVIAALTALVQNEMQLYLARFLLGAAEAGALPILLVYVSRWAPQRRRARTLAIFLASLPIAGAIGGPISGVILSLDGLWGLAGWQWLFLLEGIPAVIAGVLVIWRLPLSPGTVRWLSRDQAEATSSILDAEEAQRREHQLSLGSLRTAMKSPMVWLFGVALMTTAIGFYSVSFWLPTVNAQAFPDLSQAQLGLLNGLPFLVAAVVMYFAGRSADHRNEARWHGSLGVIIGALALAATPFAGGIGGLVLLTVSLCGALGSLSVLFGTPLLLLHGTAAASGVALINSVGAFGGFVGPFLVGNLIEAYSIDAAFVAVAVIMMVGAIVFFTAATQVRKSAAARVRVSP
jgi:ACS family tartrate transporter-like MFS transporter